jgi:hypothetical protein
MLRRRQEKTKPREPVPTELWYLKDESPWPKKDHTGVEVREIKDGWVRFTHGTIFTDERMNMASFLNCYEPPPDPLTVEDIQRVADRHMDALALLISKMPKQGDTEETCQKMVLTNGLESLRRRFTGIIDDDLLEDGMRQCIGDWSRSSKVPQLCEALLKMRPGAEAMKRESAIALLTTEAMTISKGTANPSVVRAALEELIP